MQVIKVGGSVLNSPAGFDRLSRIISAIRNDRLLVVISAFSKTTHNLSEMAYSAAKGHRGKALKALESIINYHTAFANELLQDSIKLDYVLNNIKAESRQISAILDSIALTKELPLRILDQILSFGESLALAITHSYLELNAVKHSIVDSAKIIVTDESYGKANPLESDTARKIGNILIPALDSSGIVITQGFVAATKKGITTTMGNESSNLSAALYAKLLGAKELHIWSDVEGIRSADPMLVPKTKPIPELDYDLAYSLGIAGLKLIYPEMINFARANSIKLIFKSAIKPGTDSTVVKPKSKLKLPIITAKSDYNLFRISTGALNGYSGNHDDLIFFDGADVILLTRNSIAALQSVQVSIITVFNISSSKIINSVSKLNIPAPFMSISEGKAVFAIAPSEAANTVAMLHKILVN